MRRPQRRSKTHDVTITPFYNGDMKTKLLILIVVLNIHCCSGSAETEPPDTHAAKALDYLTEEGTRWMNQRGCVSCHQIPAMLWSLHDAAAAGLPVAKASLDQWTQWSIQPVNFVKPAQKSDLDVQKTLSGNIDTLAALLLAIPQTQTAPWRETFVEHLCTQQNDDGSWNPCGQLPLQKRSKRETAQATTLWVTAALLKHQADGFDLDAALTFADAGPEKESTEWYATRLLVARLHQPDQSSIYRDQLLQRQNQDGGWGWLCEESSDALATGIALYALAVSQSHAPLEIQRAHRFLADTQTDSGSWIVPGTKRSAKGKPTETANYWGTAWAVVGLLQSEALLKQTAPLPKDSK